MHSLQLDPLPRALFEVASKTPNTNYCLQLGRMATVELSLFIFCGFLRPEFSPMAKPFCSCSCEKHCHFKEERERGDFTVIFMANNRTMLQTC